MTKSEKIAALSRLAVLVRDAELQKLSHAQRACSATRARLEQLGDAPSHPIEPTLADRNAAEIHDLWRMQRRIKLNQILAQETAAMLTMRERAAKALGRASVLEKLSKLDG